MARLFVANFKGTIRSWELPPLHGRSCPLVCQGANLATFPGIFDVRR
jgi:hypothetical protein